MEGLSAAGSKAKQEIGAAVDQANAFKQSIENVPVMQDRINNSLSKANTTISDLQNALSKEKANSDLSYLLDALNSGKENVGKDLNTAICLMTAGYGSGCDHSLSHAPGRYFSV